jgi:hypothetical protein
VRGLEWSNLEIKSEERVRVRLKSVEVRFEGFRGMRFAEMMWTSGKWARNPSMRRNSVGVGAFCCAVLLSCLNNGMNDSLILGVCNHTAGIVWIKL